MGLIALCISLHQKGISVGNSWLCARLIVVWDLPISHLPIIPFYKSPGMVAGTSNSNCQSAVGMDAARPIIATFYLAVYLVPLTFPAMA
jgi:hypothetical protein